MIKQDVITVCDLHPDKEATDTIEFGLDGKAYVIDLSAEPAKELRDLLQRYIDAGRRKQANPASGDKPARGEVSAAAKAKRQRLQTIRDWARTRPEFAALISDRGRVRKEIQDAWERDQQGHAPTEDDPQTTEQPAQHQSHEHQPHEHQPHDERVPAFSS
jgi:Lsr2